MKFRISGKVGQGDGMPSIELISRQTKPIRLQRGFEKPIRVQLAVSDEEMMRRFFPNKNNELKQTSAELDQRITAQENRIDEMQERINKLENLIEELLKNVEHK